VDLEQAALIAALVGAPIAVMSAAVAIFARADAKRSADAAERSAQASEDLTAIESERDEQATDDQRRAQASRISGWYGQTVYRSDLPGGKSRRFWKATVRNSSDLPVYDVRVEFHKVVAGDGPLPQSVEGTHKGVAVLPPGEDWQLDGPDDDRDNAVALTFRDAAGIIWYRDAHGLLREIQGADEHPAAPPADNG
jgi:hypothetical protein